MAQAMEIDIDIPQFLYEERQKAPEHLQRYFTTFVDLHERKLWHQLTKEVVDFFKDSESGPFRLPIFQQFVAKWEDKINTLSLVTIALSAAKQFKGEKNEIQLFSLLTDGMLEPNDSVEFLSNIISKVDKPEMQDVYVYAVMEMSHFKLKLQQWDEVKKAIDKCDKILDHFDSVQTVIYASFYRVSADYYKAKAEFAQYYKTALLYLACVNLDELSSEEKAERAYDLAISALLGDMIYNFGELLMHPILDSLKNTEYEWLPSLLFAFNSGSIGKFEALAPHFSKQPILQQNMSSMSQKICLMSLIEAVFRRSGDNRIIPFAEIAAETRLSVDEVEHLIMKALSLNLIRGSIDQVDQVVTVTWVQPRVLDLNQIDGMRRRLDEWDSHVKKISGFLSEQGGEVFAQ
ncbi:26S proteasome regulatory subunit [Apophysomyces ossiformis]|uniref:26S proteasome regulatory subunit n=1 Tax=Apophysomyces ossiformis TaxID=679940 RepID=A0A8H7C0S8_9FUNG|nr:26S proteasome regulatory subunit [Apophysomyces ossiformis]